MQYLQIHFRNVSKHFAILGKISYTVHLQEQRATHLLLSQYLQLWFSQRQSHGL